MSIEQLLAKYKVQLPSKEQSEETEDSSKYNLT